MPSSRRAALPFLALFILLFGLSPALAQDGDSTAEVTEPPAAVTVEATPEATDAPTATAPAGATYTVQAGDTLARIATRFNTTAQAIAQANGITNVNLVFVGQVLIIPGAQVTPTSTVPTATQTATATLVPGTTSTYTVVSGDTLFRIAMRFNTTVQALSELNNLGNSSVIFAGQVLQIPGAGGVLPTLTPTADATPETTAAAPVVEAEFGFGIEAYLTAENANEVAGLLDSLGMDWVKVNVNWRDLEPVEGQINFEGLDAILAALEGRFFNVLFTVSTAPDWSRTSTAEDGPPDDFADFTAFVGALAGRYAGRVDAYEIWSEPNLRREWNSSVHTISPTSYMQLLSGAYSAIKAADPSAVVVSAGLAPTGFNDGVNAINDRLYLAALYESGLAGSSDAIAAHPAGFANPPDALCCEASAGVETHFEDPSFYFLQTLDDYRQIMLDYDDGGTAIWVTSFGWGTSEDTGAPSSTYVFLTYTTLGEQAIYTPRGFELGIQLGYIGPMFLYNLNGCVADPGNAEACYFSLIGPGGQERPVFSAIANLDKSVVAQPEATPSVDATVVPATGADTTGSDTTGADTTGADTTGGALPTPATTPEANG